MTCETDRLPLPCLMVSYDPGFDPCRNTTLVLSLSVARLGREAVDAVFLTLCLGDALASARAGKQDHTGVLNVAGAAVAYTVVHRTDPVVEAGEMRPAGRRRIVSLRLAGER